MFFIFKNLYLYLINKKINNDMLINKYIRNRTLEKLKLQFFFINKLDELQIKINIYIICFRVVKMLILLLMILHLLKLADSGYLLCDNYISNKVSLIPFNCSNHLVREIHVVEEIELAVLSKRPFSMNGYGFKCSGSYIRYELTDDYNIGIQNERIQLSINENECRMMGIEHTYITDFGRRIKLECNSYSAMCAFKDERGANINGSYIQFRYNLMVTRVLLKSNSDGLVTDNGGEVLEKCKIYELNCKFNDSVYIWESNIIHDEEYILLEYGRFLLEDNFMYTKQNVTNRRLFFITGKYTYQGVEYLNTTSGLHLLRLENDQNLLYFGVLQDDLALKLDKTYSKKTEIEIEKLDEASTAYKLMDVFKNAQNKLDKQQYEQACILYKNQFNLMISLPNNYYPLTLLNGTNVYVFVTNGNIYLTACENLLSVSESFTAVTDCFKYKPVTVHDQKFNKLQGYMFNQMYINIHPDKIPCY